MTILDEAKNAVYGDRQADYGSVTDNFGTIAKLWSAVLNTPVTAEQVGLCMVQVKIARQMYKPKRDNLVDGAGYFATLEKMENEKQVKSKPIDDGPLSAKGISPGKSFTDKDSGFQYVIYFVDYKLGEIGFSFSNEDKNKDGERKGYITSMELFLDHVRTGRYVFDDQLRV